MKDKVWTEPLTKEEIAELVKEIWESTDHSKPVVYNRFNSPSMGITGRIPTMVHFIESKRQNAQWRQDLKHAAEPQDELYLKLTDEEIKGFVESLPEEVKIDCKEFWRLVEKDLLK